MDAVGLLSLLGGHRPIVVNGGELLVARSSTVASVVLGECGPYGEVPGGTAHAHHRQ